MTTKTMCGPSCKCSKHTETYYAGKGCECSAHNRSECGCDVDWTDPRIYKLEAEVERLRGQLTRAVSIAGVLLADIEDFHQGDSDDEWTRNGWNDSLISKYLLQGLREEIK